MSNLCPVLKDSCPFNEKVTNSICPKAYTCSYIFASINTIKRKPLISRSFLKTLLVVSALLFSFFFLYAGISGAIPFTSNILSKAGSGLAPAGTPAPLRPVSIEIPALKSSGQVYNVSLDENGSIMTLPFADAVFWYEGSAVPGSSGNCIIAGHKHFNGTAGILFGLDYLKAGDQVIFILENGTSVKQEVYKSVIYKDGVITDDIFNLDSDYPTTALVSRTGSYNPLTRQYNDIIAVHTR
jgi:hypothetical protein